MTAFRPIMGTNAAIGNAAVLDGQFLVATDTGQIYVDSGNVRHALGTAQSAEGGNPSVVIPAPCTAQTLILNGGETISWTPQECGSFSMTAGNWTSNPQISHVFFMFHYSSTVTFSGIVVGRDISFIPGRLYDMFVSNISGTPAIISAIDVGGAPETRDGLAMETAYDWYLDANCGAFTLSTTSSGHYLIEPNRVPMWVRLRCETGTQFFGDNGNGCGDLYQHGEKIITGLYDDSTQYGADQYAGLCYLKLTNTYAGVYLTKAPLDPTMV